MNATTNEVATEQQLRKSAVTHFEIYGPEPAGLADFYRQVFGWEVEQMPGVNYWRIQTGAAEGPALHGGLTYRGIPDLNGWMLFVNVASLDETVALVQSLGGSIVRPKTAVPRTAWVTIVADPAKNIFGVWQADSTAFPMPEPD
jgi:predicted enzyme related to lactoylglutathione lyase